MLLLLKRPFSIDLYQTNWQLWANTKVKTPPVLHPNPFSLLTTAINMLKLYIYFTLCLTVIPYCI